MLTEYKEIVNNIVGQKSEQTMTVGKQMFDTLARISLPQKLDALTSDDVGLPEGTWSKVQDVQSKGGVNQVEQMMISLRNFAEHSKNMIAGEEQMLNAEESDDNMMRSQYGP